MSKNECAACNCEKDTIECKPRGFVFCEECMISENHTGTFVCRVCMNSVCNTYTTFEFPQMCFACTCKVVFKKIDQADAILKNPVVQ